MVSPDCWRRSIDTKLLGLDNARSGVHSVLIKALILQEALCYLMQPCLQ